MSCRICLEETGSFIQPCNCKGSTGNVHPDCLIKWLEISGKEQCEICMHEYKIEDVHYFKCVVFPKFVISEDQSITSCVQLVGVVFYILFEYLALFDGEMTQEVLLCTNVFQVCSLPIFIEKGDLLNILLVWKCMSSFTLLLASKLHGDFTYAFIELGITLQLAIIVYVRLVMKQSKRTARVMIV